MYKYIYNFLRRYVSQKNRDYIKHIIYKFKHKYAFIWKVTYGTFNVYDLKQHLERKLPKSFDILMVHISYNDILPMYKGGVFDLLNLFLEICKKGKTLAMPAFFFGREDYDPVRYYQESPFFYIDKTPSQMGLVTEIFRRYSKVKRSFHPTHSVCAYGPLSDLLVNNHHIVSSTFGKDTPFEIMTRYKTVILGIGTTYLRHLTQVHSGEDVLGDEFPIHFISKEIPVKLVDENNNMINYNLKFRPDTIKRDMSVLKKWLDKDKLKTWKFHGAHMYYTFANDINKVVVEHARRGETIYGDTEIYE